uniref:Prenyl transferase n=1 Tax=Arundo donax TaxID=35708 RepID=A0A0A9G7D9_ARUDO
MNSFLPSSHPTIIYDIIMYQTCSVNHLNNLCQALMFRS